MSDPHPPFDPHKSLRRATKITSTNGHVVQHLVNGSSALSVAIAKNRSTGFGASIKGKFKAHSEFERSKSLNDVPVCVAPTFVIDELVRSPSSVSIPSHPSSKTPIKCSHLSETPDALAVSELTAISQQMENAAVAAVPDLIQRGTLMTKVSLKRNKNLVLRVDADLGQIVWESRQQKISECQICIRFSPSHNSRLLQSP